MRHVLCAVAFAILIAIFPMRGIAACPPIQEAHINNRLFYVRTVLFGAAAVDNNSHEPEEPKDASAFAKLTSTMLSLKQLVAKLACAVRAIHPFTASSDLGIATAATRVEKLYRDQIAVANKALDLMRDDSGMSSGALADEISTIQLKSKTFWNAFVSVIGVDTPGLLFTDSKEEKGVPNELRITVPEHVALLNWLSSAPEFSYLRDAKPHSRGAWMGFALFKIVLASRPLLHSDGKIFPLKEASFPKNTGTGSSGKIIVYDRAC